MSRTFILTFVGADRPGLVEAISGAVATAGGNWLESRMARLGGQFAGVARIESPVVSVATLEAALAAAGRSCGLAVSLATDSSPPADPEAGGIAMHLDLVGQDRPGIVSQITRALSTHGVNVESFESSVESAAMAGGALFRCTAEIRLPTGLAIETLRADLERIAADLMVDLSLGSEPR